MKAFKAYDIRGVYGVDFTKEDVYKIGYFLPELLQTTKVLVGRDVRISSPEMYDYLTKGITDAGADVYDLGLATTPYVYWVTARFGFEASVQITASHNAKQYNGLKISGKNAFPIGYDSGLHIIEKKLENTEIIVRSKGIIFPYDKSDDYVTFLKSWVQDLSGLKISMDCSNGMASLFVKQILGDLPDYLFFELDGTFPNHEANPLVAENLVPLQNHVRENKSDVGVIFDGDADRVMFVDEQGGFISPDLMIAVIGQYFYEKGFTDANVVQDIRTSKAVSEYLAKFGHKVDTWKVGRAFAAPKLKEIDGLYGGEFAGHYYFKDFYYSDSGILACLIILNVLKKVKEQGMKLSEFVRNISPYYSTGEINFVVEAKQQAIDAAVNAFISEEKPEKIYDFDGVRCDFRNWWFNIRPSNTEPYLRFIAEANSPEKLDEVKQKINKLLEPFIDD